MEKITINKNKGEYFQCSFQVEGTKIDSVETRLCLEFSDNKNMFFKGTLGKDGQCTFNIPELKDASGSDGRMVIEAIADSSYFKVYECKFELSAPVEVKIAQEITQHSTKNINMLSEIKTITPPPQEKKKMVMQEAVPDAKKKTIQEAAPDATMKQWDVYKEAEPEPKKPEVKNPFITSKAEPKPKPEPKKSFMSYLKNKP